MSEPISNNLYNFIIQGTATVTGNHVIIIERNVFYTDGLVAISCGTPSTFPDCVV